jgi:predicted nucleotidyltransferase
MDIETLKQELLKRLEPLGLEKVILFGSHARGDAAGESDIDLYVVTRDEFVPRSYSEKMDIRLKISSSILDLRMEYPIDLIVHTQPMHEKFYGLDSSFSREIREHGMRIL